MSNYLFPFARAAILQADIDLVVGDVRSLLFMSNSTVPSENSAEKLTGAQGFTTLDEMTGAGYARVTIGSKSVDIDAINDLARWKHGALNFGATITNGPRQVAGWLEYLNGGSDATSIPIMRGDTVDSGPTFPHSPAGGQILLTFAGSIVLVW